MKEVFCCGLFIVGWMIGQFIFFKFAFPSVLKDTIEKAKKEAEENK